MKTTERTPQQLIGKIVYFFRTAGAHHGCRRGKVIGVDAGPRIGLRSVTVRLASAGGWTGVRIRVSLAELTMHNHTTGVLWFGKLRPLMQWVAREST